VRVSPIMLCSMLLAACDTMHAHGIRISAVPTVEHPDTTEEDVAKFVRDALLAQGLKKGPSFMPEVWEWRDPDHPPGLRATIELVGNGSIRVHLSQDLYGPVGETEKYKSVKMALINGGKRRFGSKSVQVE